MPTKNPAESSPEYLKKLALYERLVATAPDVERKGDTMPYTSVNGNMFSLLTREGWLALRLAEAERNAFIEQYDTKLCEQYGVVMREYVVVPDALLANTRALAKHFAASYKYTKSLKAKPTTKKPKTTVAPARKAAKSAAKKRR